MLVGLMTPVCAGLYLAPTSSWAVLQQLFLLTRYPLPTTRADLLRRVRLAAYPGRGRPGRLSMAMPDVLLYRDETEIA